MGNTIQVEKANERCQMLYEILKEDPGKKFKVKDLLNLFSISYNTLYRDIDNLEQQYPESIAKERGAIYYIPAPKKEEKIVVASTRYPDYRNDEGYMDLTASKAINNVEPKKVEFKKTVEFAPGQVWDVKSSNGTTEKYIILSVEWTDSFAICTPYFTNDVDGNISSCHKLYYKPLKYFIERSWNIPLSMLTDIRNELSSFLGIEPVEKIVEVKVPEKVVETATNPNAIYTEADMEMALTKQKADIYEECFKMMCSR